MDRRENTYAERGRDALRALAESVGCTAMFATPYVLQLDVDYPKAWRGKALISLAQETGLLPGAVWVSAWPSRNGGLHVEIELPQPMPVEERVKLQALLGSDPAREILNLQEARHAGPDREETIVLFRPKSAKVATGEEVL